MFRVWGGLGALNTKAQLREAGQLESREPETSLVVS